MQRKVFIPAGLTVNHPFFYIIQHTPSGKYYAGYCCKKRYCDSDKFMTDKGYKTSSKIIKQFITDEGLSAFKVLKIRHFKCRLNAINYEARFLSKVNAIRNPNFLNQTNGDKNFIIKYVTREHRRKNSEAQMGKTMSVESRTKMSKSRIGKIMSSETIQRMREAKIGKILSEEHKKKIGEKHRGKFVSDKTRERLGTLRKGKTHTEDTKKKNE